ncbi:hypothetical protein [Streptomyces sp. NPDC007205]|uniref:hypothetical protein n=1 Tax=Streptomyces sp. NPDC007205 TaxID=3154316 RepID=UPI003410C894
MSLGLSRRVSGARGHEALAKPLGIAEQTDPAAASTSRNFSDADAEIRVDLPVSLAFSRGLVADLITQKLALEGVTFSWHPAGRKPYVLVKKTRRPPKKAAFRDPKVRELVTRAPGPGGDAAGRPRDTLHAQTAEQVSGQWSQS